jgi:hypothetical protein
VAAPPSGSVPVAPVSVLVRAVPAVVPAVLAAASPAPAERVPVVVLVAAAPVAPVLVPVVAAGRTRPGANHARSPAVVVVPRRS